MKRIPNPPAHFEQLRLKTEFIEPSQLLRLARMDPNTHLDFHVVYATCQFECHTSRDPYCLHFHLILAQR
jgi:hypothetical protein